MASLGKFSFLCRWGLVTHPVLHTQQSIFALQNRWATLDLPPGSWEWGLAQDLSFRALCLLQEEQEDPSQCFSCPFLSPSPYSCVPLMEFSTFLRKQTIALLGSFGLHSQHRHTPVTGHLSHER